MRGVAAGTGAAGGLVQGMAPPAGASGRGWGMDPGGPGVWGCRVFWLYHSPTLQPARKQVWPQPHLLIPFKRSI